VLLVPPPQPITPVIVRVVGQPAKEINVADILLGSVGITGLFLGGAALLGLVLGGLFILVRRWQAARNTADSQPDGTFQLTVPPETASGRPPRV
jgi:hypothetical protein